MLKISVYPVSALSSLLMFLSFLSFITLHPIICYAHEMVPIIIVAYGHVERLNILNACPNLANANGQFVSMPEQTRRKRITFFFILTLNIDTSNNDNCLRRVESSATRMMEQRDLETYALFKILSYCSNCRDWRS